VYSIGYLQAGNIRQGGRGGCAAGDAWRRHVVWRDNCGMRSAQKVKNMALKDVRVNRRGRAALAAALHAGYK